MNDKTTDVHPFAQRLNDEMLEALDEELELELDDDRLDAAVEHITEDSRKRPSIARISENCCGCSGN